MNNFSFAGHFDYDEWLSRPYYDEVDEYEENEDEAYDNWIDDMLMYEND